MNNTPVKGEFLDILLRSPQTIFSTKDAALLWKESNASLVSDRLKSYVRSGKLVRVRRGFYAKDENYNRLELATRIYTPAYISFETVLAKEGIVFQYYGNIFVASYVGREIVADGQTITFVKMTDYVLRNTAGIFHQDGIAIATKERAFLDRLYVSKEYYFDNLDRLDWSTVFDLVSIYQNQRLEKKVQEYYQLLDQ